jgi:DNA-binding FadR family transcriptional regulator
VPQPITRALVSDQVFRSLCDAILSGRYEPGEKLPTQRALAADLGVNMASVREAVKRLEQLGLVDVRHGDAMRVRDWRSEGGLDVVVHLLFAAGGLDRATLAAVLEARRLMLAEAARLAASRRSDDQGQRLEELAARIRAEGDPVAAQLLDLAFMTELVEASQNVVFVLILNTVRRLYLEHAGLFGAVVADPVRLVPHYARAARAVQRGDSTRAASEIGRLAAEQERLLLGAAG